MQPIIQLLTLGAVSVGLLANLATTVLVVRQGKRSQRSVNASAATWDGEETNILVESADPRRTSLSSTSVVACSPSTRSTPPYATAPTLDSCRNG